MKRLLLFLPLMACVATQPPDRPVPDAAGDTCNAGRYADLIGSGRDTLEKTLILQPVRIITPGQPVTMDYLETRLNIMLDETETVVRLSCG